MPGILALALALTFGGASEPASLFAWLGRLRGWQGRMGANLLPLHACLAVVLIHFYIEAMRCASQKKMKRAFMNDVNGYAVAILDVKVHLNLVLQA